jgi:phage-related protein
MSDKPLFWLGSSLEDVRAFSKEARRAVGHQLGLVQRGLEPRDWKAMPTVGVGVYEIRVHAGTEYRVFYVAKFAESVYVLHAFEKRTRQTPQVDIAVAKKRLGDLRRLRGEREERL